MTKHTPGPWTAEMTDKPYNVPLIYAAEHTGPIAEIRSRLDVAAQHPLVVETRNANARLIAAAPDLLAVAQELAASAGYWSEYDVPLGIVDRLRAAIAKATGESHD